MKAPETEIEFEKTLRRISCRGVELAQDDVSAIKNALKIARTEFRKHVNDFKAAEAQSRKMEKANAAVVKRGHKPKQIPFITGDACVRMAQQFELQIKETEEVMDKLEFSDTLIVATQINE